MYCRAMRGNWSELCPARKSPRCHVNTPLLHHVLETSRGKLRSGASHTLKRRHGVTEIQLRHNREPMQFFQRRNNVVRFFWKYRSSGQWLVIEPKFWTTWSLRRLVRSRSSIFCCNGLAACPRIASLVNQMQEVHLSQEC